MLEPGLEEFWPVLNFGEELRSAIDAVDPRLHEFMSVAVNSFIRLEILVLFRRAQCDLSADDVSQELGWPVDRVREELKYLKSTGVLEACDQVQGNYRLSSVPSVAEMINKFGFLYANRGSRLLILGHLLRQGRINRD